MATTNTIQTQAQTQEVSIGSVLNQSLGLISTTLSHLNGTVDNLGNAVELSSAILNRSVEVADESNQIWAKSSLAKANDKMETLEAKLAEAKAKRNS